MDCSVVQPELIPYHFGTIDEEARVQVEAHLLACGSCLRDFIALKREIETSGSKERPSQNAKERLRRAVGTELELRRPRVVRSRWERPLAVCMAGATVWAALSAVHFLASSPGAAPRSIEPAGHLSVP